jgi:phosphoglycolate phosphatase
LQPFYRAVLFDLDGTLVDSFPGIAATIDATLAEASIPPADHAAIRRLVGAPLESIFGALVPALNEAACLELANRYRALYWSTGVPHTPLFPGMREVLDAGRDNGLELAIVTTKRVDIATHLLEVRGLTQHFRAVVGGDSTPHHKPHPAPAQLALATLGVAPDHAVVVGDTTFDVEMAHAAGCRAVGVTWGYGGAETLRAAGAHHLVADAAALQATLLGAAPPPHPPADAPPR